MEKHTNWNIETYAAHNEALRAAEEKFQEERDRRYNEKEELRKEISEVREKAHANALGLAREIQVYKDEKANELREQINHERLLYVRKDDIQSMEEKYDAILKPILEYTAGRQGRETGVDKTLYYLIAVVGLAVAILIGYFKYAN